MHITLIGITDNPHLWLPPHVLEIIAHATTFSGGKRHHALVEHLLPEGHHWIDITVPVADVVAQYERLPQAPGDTLVCFVSGDPFFFGFGATLQRLLPQATLVCYPEHNSLQTLAHRMLLPYEGMHMVSQTGRPWQPLDQALAERHPLIGVLTDRHRTPHHIAQHLIEYGFTDYVLTVGECLGNPQQERVRTFALHEAPLPDDYRQPCCCVLRSTTAQPAPLGIPESDFHLLNGRVNMITKAPIRLCTLSQMQLHRRHTMWDVGFCTGSVSIEARLQFPHLGIHAFEIRPEGEELIRANMRRHGAPGIEVHMGDFLQQPLSSLPRPDAVFIGGHGGHLREMVERIRQHILPGGVIAMNSVSEESRQAFIDAVGPCHETRITLDEHNPISILTAEIPTTDTLRDTAAGSDGNQILAT